jgi:hypothetical protein
VCRLPAILLLLCFVALGSGVLEFLHNQQHEQEDAAQLAAAQAAGVTDLPKPVHDESNCAIHAQLHLPAIAAGWVPLLILLGLFVAFLSLLTPALHSQRTPLRIACRGPPAR